MEGGYVNEVPQITTVCGQLKTKNGQKYVFNGPPSGIYVTRTCVFFTALLALVALIFTILITYFLTANSATTPSCLNGNSNKNAPPLALSSNMNNPQYNSTPVGVASMFGMAPPTSSPTTRYDTLAPIAPIGDINVPPDHDILGTDKSKVIDRKLQLHDGWRPLHYNIVIEPNIVTASSNGSIAIEVQRDANIPVLLPIILDVHNISISNVRVIRSPYNASAAAEEIELDFDGKYGESNSTFVVAINKGIEDEHEVKLIVSMDFVSQITDTLQGVYRTSYTNLESNKIEWMVSTQFSPVDARRAFPCFDRPDMKANFTISIIRDNKLRMALSNMPLQRSSVHRPGFTRDDFQTSPKMPIYSFAFVVSNLVKSHYSDLDANMIPRVEIWTRPENTEMTNYAYSMLRKFLPYFEEYFGVKNRLAKIDMVSIPDFGFSAMENWGLITFRDSALLVPEDLDRASSSEHMEHVAQIVAHELAHQWFGNLVTPKWWDDLWLKEGFASYMSYLALNSIRPEFQLMDTYTINEFGDAMQHDADNSSHSITFDVKSTNDINRIFDPITYSKGNILLRMLSSFVGDEAFRAAIQDLLKTYAYANADRDELWEFMTRYGHEHKTLPDDLHVKTVMDSWITKPGYPVITVERREADLVLTQERYMLPSKNMSDDSRWVVPITFETDELHKGDNIPTHWMLENDRQIVINEAFTAENNTDNVVYVNLNRQGYYRVNYDMPSWLALKKKFTTLPRITRAQLLDDALHLAQAEYLTYDIPLTFLMEIFTATDDELLWRSAQPGLNYLIFMLHREPAYETFRAFMKFIVRPAFDRYGLNEPDNESHIQLQHRANIARLACKFNYDRCTMPAHRKYREWMSDAKQNPIKPNLKSIIYCTALAEGSFQEWYFAYKQYKRTTSASEKEQILTSLGCTTKPWLLSKYLNMTINPTSGILKQDGERAFRAVAENPIGYEIAFDFLQSNIKEIAEYFGDGFSTLSQMIKSITTYMNKEYHKEQLQQFADRAHKLGLTAVEEAIGLAMEQVNNNIYWREHSYYQLKGFLEAIVSEFRIEPNLII
ncbi:aminopeptidase N isoform X1 [Ceratitis capitata]|uniref:aminopeptidase N isoform X1 n=1 Tax=Ceratitis capitata TaxID=7213 RepID=UPI0006189399|nr:aminopeptidase N isoform X1 [Ceratitis capitata]XP_012161753.1 aminopeptidase N isoform X1 [Ceratitis capitata]XP_012161754.1 aminopeptidase N isoform X1 [Ceratitis capitata]XP_012161755.1 aminopeptidase N isoform X1 [Ceratitis capitata]XP_012161756.1 aminopeptidase N isoform X1 [Ceratitis capitata]XP_020717390.1 aminopeptidase N isoform X1 [Ceratitis capitata]